MNCSQGMQPEPNYRYYLNFGSNLGNRRENISLAIQRIEKMLGHGVCSELAESEPWGFDSANSFINAGFAADSLLEPFEMLRLLKKVESELSAVPHRNADNSYCDREIDIDIMTAWDEHGEIHISSPELTVPHPHLAERDFFLNPLRQLYQTGHIAIRSEGHKTYLLLDADNNIPTLRQTAFTPFGTLFAVAGNLVASEAVSNYCPENFKWVELRESWKYLGDKLWALASKAAELIYWNQETLFCGRCGSVMTRVGEIEKRCGECGAERFPRLSPCVLVLVEKDDKALLVHNSNMRKGMHSLVAGFVETGESLEECVAREVKEETSLEVADIEYFGSQSWPFPGQLMMAFRCRWVSGSLKWADGELSGGGFMTRDDVQERLQKSDLPPFSLPSLPSLSRRLIDAWLKK